MSKRSINNLNNDTVQLVFALISGIPLGLWKGRVSFLGVPGPDHDWGRCVGRHWSSDGGAGCVLDVGDVAAVSVDRVLDGLEASIGQSHLVRSPGAGSVSSLVVAEVGAGEGVLDSVVEIVHGWALDFRSSVDWDGGWDDDRSGYGR